MISRPNRPVPEPPLEQFQTETDAKDGLLAIIEKLKPFPKNTQQRIVDTIIVFLALDKKE